MPIHAHTYTNTHISPGFSSYMPRNRRFSDVNVVFKYFIRLFFRLFFRLKKKFNKKWIRRVIGNVVEKKSFFVAGLGSSWLDRVQPSSFVSRLFPYVIVYVQSVSFPHVHSCVCLCVCPRACHCSPPISFLYIQIPFFLKKCSKLYLYISLHIHLGG